MPTGWDSILTVISFGDCFGYGLEMLLVYLLFTLVLYFFSMPRLKAKSFEIKFFLYFKAFHTSIPRI